ncbi:Nramp family divalent metal transporter [uncultured Paludibaculum sp.]|uniref:Nramp family divalent metal transporter n=1 Tax=uncultured Paludibaculum sp. TaxID=1765020 RepID=UPI002AAB61FF|nr:Nramp family divalent metal transporter [uncultured Paludibaculum sp.]
MDSNGTQSLSEVHSSVATAHPSIWRRMFAFAGPAYLVSVGYMDPGNWATDLEGGARFGYQLLWVLVLSNAMAILLQTLSARLGIVTGRDLAQACREAYPKQVSNVLWVLCEIAIAACDLAELLGAAIGLSLLFKLPLIVGVLLSTLDTLLVLWFNRYGIRMLESIILAFVSIIGACFLFEVLLAKPSFHLMAQGLIPRLNDQSLYVAIGILGATVMPHNLYLHSSLVQTRTIGKRDEDKRSACKYNLVDSVVALNGALLVNAAILIMAAATFFKNGIVVTEIQQAHQLLAPLLGTTLAGGVFAVALICSGQSSTITGTMAGQIVMEGFLDFRMRPWLRRLITRSMAVIPAVITIAVTGEQGAYKLLILSQVVLSLQLPFAVIPLIRFTSDRRQMGNFTSPNWVKALAWTCTAIIISLNLWLAWTTLEKWPTYLALPLSLGLIALLGWVAFAPFRQGSAVKLPDTSLELLKPPVYRTILVTLDHTRLDRTALSHATALAKGHKAKIHLLHVEEGVTSQVYGALAETAEVEKGRQYFSELRSSVEQLGLETELTVVHAIDPKSAIVRFSRECKPDLIVMGAHGHKGLKDLVFGATINEVRHAVGVPVLVVQDDTHAAPN